EPEHRRPGAGAGLHSRLARLLQHLEYGAPAHGPGPDDGHELEEDEEPAGGERQRARDEGERQRLVDEQHARDRHQEQAREQQAQRDAGRDRGQGQERVLEPDQAPELAPRRAHQRQEPELLVARAQEGAARVEDEEEREDGDEHEADRQHVPRDRAPVEVAALHVGVEKELRVDEEERDRERAREQEGGVAQPAAPEVAERELRERHDAKPPIALRVSSSCWKNAWRLPPRLSSVNARPSLTNTTRRQKLAANGSWVTMTTVTPCSSLSARRACITSFADLESRLPVSSSASTTAGSWTMARAIAARCCWPPETS